MPILLMLLYYFSFSAFLMPLSRLMKMFWRCSFKCFHFSLFPACFHPHPKWHAPFLVMKMSHFPFQHSIHNKAWRLTISFENMFGIKVLPRTPQLSKCTGGLKQKPLLLTPFSSKDFSALSYGVTFRVLAPETTLWLVNILRQPIRSFYIFGFQRLHWARCACAFPELGVLPGLTQKNVFFRAK